MALLSSPWTMCSGVEIKGRPFSMGRNVPRDSWVLLPLVAVSLHPPLDAKFPGSFTAA